MRSIFSLLLISILSISSNGSSFFYTLSPNISHLFISSNPDSLAKVYNNTGVDFAMEGNFEKAGVFFLKSLRIRESIPDFPKEKLANGYLNLANLKKEMNYPDSALFFYNKAESLLKGIEGPTSSNLGVIFVEKGNCLKDLQEYVDAIIYIRKGIDLLNSDSLKNVNRLIPSYQKLSNSYLLTGNIDDAIDAARKAYYLSLRLNRMFLFQTSFGLGNCYLKSGNYTVAIKFFCIADQQGKKSSKLSRSEFIGLYNSIGLSYWKTGKYDSVEHYFRKGVDITSENKANAPHAGMLFRNYARFSMDVNNFELAEKLLLKSLEINSKQTGLLDPINFNAEIFFQPTLGAQCFEGLGDLYFERFQLFKNIEFAKKSFDYYRKSIEIINLKGQVFVEEDDKLWMTENFHITYLKAIQAAIQFSSIDSTYIDYAFQLASKAKASVLLQALNKLKGLKYSDVPNELVSKEQALSQRVVALKEKYMVEKDKTGSLSLTAKTIENRLFEAQREYRSLVSKIEKEYPNYYSLKFDTTSLSISKVQRKIKPTQLLVDYIITDSSLISIALTNEKVCWTNQKIDSTFFNHLHIFLDELNPQNFDTINQSNISRYASASYYLYRLLLEPYQPLLKNRELIVIPHLQLASIPFSALIIQNDSSAKGYYALPFLTYNTPISYYPSSKLFYTSPRSNPTFWLNTLSFAPDYKNFIDPTKSLPYEQNLYDLPGAEKESSAIVDIFGGKLVSGQNATEGYFKAIVSDYDILHLAMHTFIYGNNPLFSKLVFSVTNDSTEDGFLNMYEMYGLKLNCKLAIISACRSSDGNLASGEGLISLARSFQYAGCPALIASLWKVDDFSGEQIMVDFSRNIKRGMSKSEALQLAQVNFIQNADPIRSHPFFWATYQLIGETDPLCYSTTIKTVLWFTALLLCFGILWGGFKLYKNKSLK